MKMPTRSTTLLLAVSCAGLLTGCATTDKKEAKKEVEGVDYVMIKETGSLMPRKVRTKTDVLNSQNRRGDLDEIERVTGEGARAPSDVGSR